MFATCRKSKRRTNLVCHSDFDFVLRQLSSQLCLPRGRSLLIGRDRTLDALAESVLAVPFVWFYTDLQMMIATSFAIPRCTWLRRVVRGRGCISFYPFRARLVPAVLHAVLRMILLLERVDTTWLLDSRIRGCVLLVLFTVHR